MRTRQLQFGRPMSLALGANAAALALIGVALLARPDGPSFLPSAVAQNQLPMAGGAGVFIVPAQFSSLPSGRFGCYLIDVDAQTLSAYEMSTATAAAPSQLRLIAARSFRHDRRLGNYNTFPPPGEIEALNEKAQVQIRAAQPADRAPANPEDPNRR